MQIYNPRMVLRASVSLCVLAWFVGLPQGALAGISPIPHQIRLTWSEDPKTTQTIGWTTDSSISGGKVEFADAGGALKTVDAPPPDVLTTNIGTLHLFSVTLRGLQPGTRYRYRLGGGTYWSAYRSFETEKAEEGSFQFLVFGDSHEKKPVYRVWKETVNAAWRQNPAARFIVNVGDLIYAGRDYQQWQAWLAAAQDVIATIPEMPAIGDHEPRGLTSKDEWQRPDYFTRLFKVPQNGPEGFKGEVYSFDYGAAHIAVLNSSFHYEFSDQGERDRMIQAEKAWLDADLGATRKPWKIVVYHDASYNLQADRSGTLTKVHFGPIIDRHHVDLVLNAHDHALARSYYIRNEEVLSGPAQGTVYYISGRSGDNAKEGLGPKLWHPFYYDPQEQACYLAVEVTRGTLTVSARLADGKTVDRFVVNRDSPGESTPAVPFGRYGQPRFGVFGTLLQFGAPPERNEAGEWFVDIDALATVMSGTFDRASSVLSYDGGQIRLQFADRMFRDSSKRMVSLSGLVAAGFHCVYRESMNVIMVERWRD